MPSMEADILGRLYREHAPALRLFARQWPHGGEDLVQDAFVKLAQQSPPPVQQGDGPFFRRANNWTCPLYLPDPIAMPSKTFARNRGFFCLPASAAAAFSSPCLHMARPIP